MSRLVIVLHRPIYPRNVGMCCRAIGNMDGARLVVIGPQCDLSDEAAKQGAAHAQDVLRNAKVYPDLQTYLANEGEGIRIALSGRDGRLKRPDSIENVLANALSADDHPMHDPRVPIYLHFGPEDDGMSNEEMELCHHVCRLPTYGNIVSLNLSHAVLLTQYIVQRALLEARPVSEEAEPATVTVVADAADAESKRPVYYPSQTIRRWLEALGFDLSARRVNIEKTLNRILLSRCPTPEELRIIDLVLQQTVRKLTNQPED